MSFRSFMVDSLMVWLWSAIERSLRGTRNPVHCSGGIRWRCMEMTALTDDPTGAVDGHDVDEARALGARRREADTVSAQVDVQIRECVLEAGAADAAAALRCQPG